MVRTTRYLHWTAVTAVTTALVVSHATGTPSAAPAADRTMPAIIGAQQRAEPAPSTAGGTTAPVAQDSVRFAVIGDTGTGDRAQYDVERNWRSRMRCSRSSL